MTNPNKTLIAIILDESGSMQNVIDDTIGGFNTFIESQRKVTTDEAFITLTTFADAPHVVFSTKPLAAVEPISKETYVPGGNTALYDAIGETIERVGKELAAQPEDDRPGNVVVCVMTDGHENASRDFLASNVKEMIEHQQSKYNWQFIFIGANQDAILTGGRLGIAATNSLTYAGTKGSTRSTIDSLSANVGAYRSSGGQTRSLHFTKAQRDKAAQA
jgi:uncharacterized protein YegL